MDNRQNQQIDWQGIGKKIQSVLLKIAFTICYSLTVVPFTANFFHKMAEPPDSSMLFLATWSLVSVHIFCLPLFLCILEFTSVYLATHFWKLTSSNNRGIGKPILILCLFGGMQLLPMVSVFFDTRETDYQRELSAHQQEYEKKLTDITTGVDEDISRTNESIAAKQKSWSKLEEKVLAITSATPPPTPRYKRLNKQWVIVGYNTASGRKQQQENIDGIKGQQTTLLTEIEGLKTARIELEKKHQEIIENHKKQYGFAYQSPIDYVVKTLHSQRSLFVLFIALILPLVVFSVGFVLSNNESSTRNNSIPNQGSWVGSGTS